MGKKEVRIAIFNWRDIKNPRAGGAEIVTHEYAESWVKSNHNVILVSPLFPGGKKEEILHGVKIVRLGIRTEWNYLLIQLLAFFYYHKHLKGNIDLVIDQIHWIPFFTPYYVREKKLAFIHEVAQKIWLKQFGITGFFGKLIEPLMFRPYKKTRFLTVSESTKDDLIHFNIPPKNITVIPNGINFIPVKKVPLKNNTPTFVFLGRIVPVKNLEDLIEAFVMIRKNIPNAELKIIGSQADRNYYQKIITLISKRQLNDAIRFYGYVSEKEKERLLEKSHILLHPSLVEGWGLNICEANAFGIPAVVYQSSGLINCVKDGVNGRICTVNSPGKLASLAVSLLNDRRQYKKMSNRCLEYAANFSWDKSFKKSLNLIEKL